MILGYGSCKITTSLPQFDYDLRGGFTLGDTRLIRSSKGFNTSVLCVGDALVITDNDSDRVSVYLVHAITSVSMELVNYRGDIEKFVVTDFIGDWGGSPRYEMTKVDLNNV